MDAIPRSMGAGRIPRTAVVLVIGMGLVLAGIAAAGPASASHGSDHSSHMVVELEEDGSATAQLVVAFDLTDEERRDAFHSLKDDESARAEFREQFADQMRMVAAEASEETGREMAISNPSIDLSQPDDGEVGTATLTVHWSNLASQEDGRLVVTNPFDGGFTPSHAFVVISPDGYRITEASPAPDTRKETLAIWNAGRSLDGFRVVIDEVEDVEGGGEVEGSEGVEEDSTQQDVSQSSGQPGFGLVGGMIALLAAAFVFRKRPA